MNKKITNWNEIENWINSQFSITSFSNLLTWASIDKDSCLKIMQNKMFGYSSDELYNISGLPEDLKSDFKIAVLAIELSSNNFFELPDSLIQDINFHRLLNKNEKLDYEYLFGHSPTSVRCNKEYIMEIISDYPNIYSSLTEDLLSDKNILCGVLNKKVFPEKLPSIFSNDKKIVFKLINIISKKQNEMNSWKRVDKLISFISKDLLIDRTVLIKLYSSIKFLNLEIPDSFKNDEEVVISAVKSYPRHYNKLDDNLKINDKVVVEAFKGEHNLFLKYFSQYNFNYNTILEFILSLTKPVNPKWAWEFPNNSDEFEKIVEKIVEKNMFINEIAFHLVSIWPSDIYFYKYFKILSSELKKDKKMLSLLLKNSASDNSIIFHEHQEVFKDYITSKYIYENYVLPNHPNDTDLILNSLFYTPSSFIEIPQILTTNEDIILETYRLISQEKRNELLSKIPVTYKNNKKFLLKLLSLHLSVEIDGCDFNFASDILRDDNDFVKEAIKTLPQSIMFSSERIKNDIEFQKFAFKMFKKFRKKLRNRHSGLPKRFNIPFANGKSDELLDFEFLEKFCSKLLNDNNFILKNKINLKPWTPWEPWWKIKDYWRNEFEQNEIFKDENEHVIIFKNKNSYILIGYFHYSNSESRILSNSNELNELNDFIDFINELGRENYNQFKVILMCNRSISKINKKSETLSLPNNVDYYYVNYNYIFESIEIIPDNPSSY